MTRGERRQMNRTSADLQIPVERWLGASTRRHLRGQLPWARCGSRTRHHCRDRKGTAKTRTWPSDSRTAPCTF